LGVHCIQHRKQIADIAEENIVMIKTKAAHKIDTPTLYAAQNAQLGLINANDLSLLLGVDAGRLNRFAKTGSMVHYGEYHGKRFFNFQEIINWVTQPDDENEAKPVVRANLEAMLKKKTCPYSLEKTDDANPSVKIVWKELHQD
jgi:hypothetical protein